MTEFTGSRNFTEEQVSDLMWFGNVGLKIEIEILEENKISVRYF